MARKRPLPYRGLSQRRVDAYEKGVLPWLRRAGRGIARLVIEPLDFAVGVVGVVAGIGYATFLAVDGASATAVGLVLVLVAVYTLFWAFTSWALDWWRR